MRSKVMMQKSINTRRVQAVVPMATVDRLIKAATKRKMSVSSFIGVAIEKQLNEVESA